MLIILKPLRQFAPSNRLGVCATTWTGSKRTISKLGFLRQLRSPILTENARSMQWRKPDAASLANDGGTSAMELLWRKLLPNQIHPTETNWILVPQHCVVDELGAEPPLDVAADTTLCPCGWQHSRKNFEKSHPNIRTTTLTEKCLLCLAEMWFLAVLLAIHALPTNGRDVRGQRCPNS